MKRKIILSVLSVITALICSCCIVACKDDAGADGNVSDLNGVYFQYGTMQVNDVEKYGLISRYVLNDGTFECQQIGRNNDWTCVYDGTYSVNNGNLVLKINETTMTYNKIEEKCFKSEMTIAGKSNITYLCIENKVPSELDKSQIYTKGWPEEFWPSALK